MEVIQSLQDEGHAIYQGSVGERVTIAGVDWSQLATGQGLVLGDEVVIELTSYAGPCRNIRKSFADGKFKRISQKQHAGESRLYARVIRTGKLAVGQAVRVLDGEAVA